MENMKTKSVHNSWFDHPTQFNCIMTTLKLIFSLKFEFKGKVKKSRHS